MVPAAPPRPPRQAERPASAWPRRRTPATVSFRGLSPSHSEGSPSHSEGSLRVIPRALRVIPRALRVIPRAPPADSSVNTTVCEVIRVIPARGDPSQSESVRGRTPLSARAVCERARRAEAVGSSGVPRRDPPRRDHRKIKCTQLKMEQLPRNASCVVD